MTNMYIQSHISERKAELQFRTTGPLQLFCLSLIIFRQLPDHEIEHYVFGAASALHVSHLPPQSIARKDTV